MSQPTYLQHVRASAGVLRLIVIFGAVVTALSLDTHTVNALDADATTAGDAWCVEVADSGVPPSCTYSDFLVCAIAAIRAGGSCKAASSIPTNTTNVSDHRAPAASRRSTRATASDRVRDSSLSMAEREKLFRQFVEWRRRSNQ